jgi:hypothetical protein
MPNTDDDFKILVLVGMATIIRLLLRDYRDDGKDAIELAVEMEKTAEDMTDKHDVEDDRGGGAG